MVLLDTEHSPAFKSNKPIRIIFGAGAVGLFFAFALEEELPDDPCFIINRSPLNLPIYIEIIGQNKKKFISPRIITSNSDTLNLNSNEIIFFICTPPESSNQLYEKITDIINKSTNLKKVIVIFLNNGFVDYQLYDKFKSNFEKFHIEFNLIRAIIISGFIREKNENNINIKCNTENKIYYGNYNSSNTIELKKYFPTLYFEWISHDCIFELEKIKFFINFILGLSIGPSLDQNKNIFNIINQNELTKIIFDYCQLFIENKPKPEAIENYFIEVIKNSSTNINSISFSWFHNNKMPIIYFVQTMQKLISLSEHKNSIPNLINYIHNNCIKHNLLNLI